MYRMLIVVTCGAIVLFAMADERKPKKTGVTTASVQRSISGVKPIAVFTVEGAPDWMAVTGDSIWVASSPKNRVVRLNPKTNKVGEIVTVNKPCSGLTYAFGSVWSPSCADHALVRFEAETGRILAHIPVGPAESEGGLCTGAGSIWMLSGKQGELSRIDPKTNQLSATIEVPRGPAACAFGEDAVWITSPELSVLSKVDPVGNRVVAKIAVGPKPRFLTFGEDSVWTLNQGDGTISRVDAHAAKLVKNIEAGIPGEGGEIAYGEGAVWTTLFGFPITKIDPATNSVSKQWIGPGGDSIRVAFGSIWLTNYKQQQVWRIRATEL